MVLQRRTVLFVMMLFTLNACDFNFFCSTEDDSVVSESRNLSEYSQIDIIEKDTHLNLTQSPTADCTVTGTNSILKNLLLDVRDDKLKIEMSACESSHKIVNIDISVKTISEITCRANSELTALSPIESAIIELNIIDDGEIKIEKLFAEKIKTNIIGSGNINIGGNKNIRELIINIDGSGNVNAYNLPADKIKVNISGSGSCRINPVSILDVRISGSGNVYYSGEPKINSNISGSGEVIQN